MAPKEWSKFKPWHEKATAGLDPLTAEERFIKLGGTIPTKKKDKKNHDDNKRINKEVE